MKKGEATAMGFTDFFIHRPIFAWVVNIIMVLLGIVSYSQLSMRQYPRVEHPVITVQTGWEGVNASGIEAQITRPMEDAFASISGLDYMTSESGNEESKIKLYFSGRELDGALADVHDRLNGRVKRDLPQEVEEPTITKGDADALPVLNVVLTSERYKPFELFDYGERSVKSALESVAGVASVETTGSGNFQMNLVMDPIKMAAFHVTAMEVVEAVRKHSLQKPAGRVRDSDREILLTTKACFTKPSHFDQLLIGEYDGRLIRLSDIGKAELCPEEDTMKVTFNGKPCISYSIRAQTQANPIEISKSIRTKKAAILQALPEGIDIHITHDESVYIERSINQVFRAIAEAIILVLLVIVVFLCSFRASLVPMITIPISLVTTFFIMSILGFTINILTLLALVLAIGLVVDDAIVVLENIYRYIEEGDTPYQAALKGTREIQSSVIAMTITLAAVYTPIALSHSSMAKFFREFALTLAGSVCISGVVALTLSPTMCARLLLPHSQILSLGTLAKRLKKLGKPFGQVGGIKGLVHAFQWFKAYSAYTLRQAAEWIQVRIGLLESFYAKWAKRALDKRLWVLGGALGFFLSTSFYAAFYLKKEFSPREDQGKIFASFSADVERPLEFLWKGAPLIEKVFSTIAENQDVTMVVSLGGDNTYINQTLVPWEDRKRKCTDVLPDLRKKLNDISALRLDRGPYCSGSRIPGSSESPLAFQLTTSASFMELDRVSERIEKLLLKEEGIDKNTVRSLREKQTLNIEVIPDREKAYQLGLDPDFLAQMVHTLIRGPRVSRFEKDSKNYPVRVILGKDFRKHPEDILSISVKGRPQGREKPAMVPLASLISLKRQMSQPTINHYNKKRSYGSMSGLSPFYGLGEVYFSLKEKIDKILPRGFNIEPAGELKNFLKEGKTILLIFALAIAFIFLVLAAQFESLKAPFVILLTVPLAVGGAICSLILLPGGSLNAYSGIGIVTLIGLITKNGILLVDFANQKVDEGGKVRDAILLSCRLRFRPILMTTLAMILGAIPLALASGAGAEARQQIGSVIVGGMTIGTLFTLFVIPAMYLIIVKEKPKQRI